LTWGRETSGPAHPNPNKRMKNKPARIRKSFPPDNRYITCRSSQRESVGRACTSEEAIPTGGCSHHDPCRGGRRHVRTDRSCRHDFCRVLESAHAGAHRPGDLARALSVDPGWGHNVAVARTCHDKRDPASAERSPVVATFSLPFDGERSSDELDLQTVLEALRPEPYLAPTWAVIWHSSWVVLPNSCDPAHGTVRPATWPPASSWEERPIGAAPSR